MLLALLASISIIDLAVHRIPNKLIALVPFLSPQGLTFNVWLLIASAVLFALPGVGAGDIKLLIAASLVISRCDPVTAIFAFAVGVFVAALCVKPKFRGRIALGPAISLMIATQI